MSGYCISDPVVVLSLIALLGVIPLVGFGIGQFKSLALSRLLSWTLVVVSVVLVERVSVREPSGTRMLLIIVALLWAMKAVVYVEWVAQKKRRLKLRQWLVFVGIWFGMRAGLFTQFGERTLPDWRMHFKRGLVRIAIGLLLILAAMGVMRIQGHLSLPGRLWLATFLLLPGLSLLIHFGLFNVLVAGLRRGGVNCGPLFRAPFLSCSLSEFWGKRWNLAFSEMTAIAVFRPLRDTKAIGRWTEGIATMIAFLFSGLLHELAISVPVQAGYGLPMLYFLIHGVGILLEGQLKRIGLDVTKATIVGRIWTMVWVLAPLPILFHRPFMEGCVWPLLQLECVS